MIFISFVKYGYSFLIYFFIEKNYNIEIKYLLAINYILTISIIVVYGMSN